MAEDESHDDRTQSFVALSKGTKVSHYTIISKIGAGGMGEVYLAEDTELHRRVALKFLPPHLCQDEDCRKRFKREAQAAAKLDHPNIVPVFEVGDFKDRPFFAMAHIEGKPLRNIIKDGKLSVHEAINYTMQICEGLNKAHESGVVHRDIKPGNIIIDKDNRPRIVDFGLATVKGEEKLTKTGSTLGTVGYMAPEQVEGKQVDHRSDLFSVGVILYEMLTGRRPFEGDNDAAVVRAITSSKPEPIARFKSGVTGELQQIVDKALSKDPSLRYQHADGMLSDLKRLQMETPRSIKSKLGLWLAAAVIVTLVGYFIISQFIDDKESDEGWSNSIAVLIFRNQSPNKDQEYFCEGMTDAIIGRLSGIKNLKVISLTSVLKLKDSDYDLKKIGKMLGVETILEGSILKEGDKIRVRAQLIDVSEDAHLWSDHFDQKLESIFDVQDDISKAIVDIMKIELMGEEKENLVKRNTNNLEAYKEYSQARYFWRKRTAEGIKKSIEHFERAIELDSTYALAYSGLADAWSIMDSYGGETGYFPEYKKMAKEAALEAVRLDANLAEAHASLGLVYYYDGDIENSEKEFLKAIELNPGYAWTHIWYGNLLGHWTKDIDRKIKHLEIALDLDPLSLVALNNLGAIKSEAGDYNAAESLLLRIIDIEPSNTNFRINIAANYVSAGDNQKAIEQYKEAIALQPTYWGLYYNLAKILFDMGKPEEAEQIWHDAISYYPDQPELYNRYGVFLWDEFKRKDNAIAQMNKAIELDSAYSVSYYYLARTYNEIGDYENAIWAEKKAIEADPGVPQYYKDLGEIYFKAGKLDSSLNVYLKYLYHRSTDMKVTRDAGHIAIQTRQYDIADSLFDVMEVQFIIEGVSWRSWGRFYKGRVLLHQGRFNEALDVLEKGIKMDKEDSLEDWGQLRKIYHRGLIFLFQENPDSAMVQFQEAKQLLHKIDSTNNNWMIVFDGCIAKVYAYKDDINKSDEIFNRLINQTSKTDTVKLGHLYSMMSQTQYSLGNFDSALVLRERMIELRGNSFYRSRELGRCFLRIGRISEAVESFEKAMTENNFVEWLYPERHVLLHYNLGKAYEAAGREEDAIEQYKTFLDIWKNADEGLESVVDAKRRLAKIKHGI